MGFDAKDRSGGARDVAVVGLAFVVSLRPLVFNEAKGIMNTSIS